MTTTNLQQWIEHPEKLNADTLHDLHAMLLRYPYFQTLRLLYLQNLYLLHDESFTDELRHSVFVIADRRVLFYLLEGEHYVLKPVSGDTAEQEQNELNIDRTLFLINSFLANNPELPSQSMNLDYTVDYTPYLMDNMDQTHEHGQAESQPLPLRGQDLIDSFLSKGDENISLASSRNKSEAEKSSSSNAEEAAVTKIANVAEDAILDAAGDIDDSCFTETLAKIYIKQHRYEKALEIIKKISLNYPKKNAYFADQIKLLEKLIINAKSK